MKVAFLASEVIPYAKTGGLADVAGALPKFLAGLGAEVRVFMPFYREVKKKNLALQPAVELARLEMGGKPLAYRVYTLAADGVKFYFIDRPDYFDREALYGTAAGDYPGQRRALRLLLPGRPGDHAHSGLLAPTSSMATTGSRL